MPAEASVRSIVVGAASSGLRRALGPTTWVVLEELLLRSNGTADECVARVSVRSLAASLAKPLLGGTERHSSTSRKPGTVNHTIFEGTREIQQLVIARAISGMRIE